MRGSLKRSCRQRTPKLALAHVDLDRSANSMLCFVLQQRSRFRIDLRDIVPGHPVYESIKAEVLAEAGRWVLHQSGGARAPRATLVADRGARGE